MVEDPLQELRYIRHQIEQACAERGQTYADYLSQAQRKYTDRLVRRGLTYPADGATLGMGHVERADSDQPDR